MDRCVGGLALLATLASACCGASNEAAGALPHARSPQELIASLPPRQKVEGAVYWGIVKRVEGPLIVMLLRDYKTLDVDISDAGNTAPSLAPTVGSYLVVDGPVAGGVLKARHVRRTRGTVSWGADVPQSH